MKRLIFKFCRALFAFSISAAFVFADLLPNEFFIPSGPPQAQYVIEVELDLSQNLLLGSERVTFRNSSPRSLALICIDWNSNLGQIIEITSEGRPLELVNEGRGGGIEEPLLYSMEKAVQPGKKITLIIRFRLRTGEITGNLSLPGRWHPRIWWDGLPVRDSYKVKFEPPKGYAMAISGRLNTRSGYYENPGVTTNFGIFIAKGVRTAVRESDGVLITSLFTDEGEKCALLCLDAAADIVSFYKRRHGFYPFDFLHLIPGASRPMGGYPFASGIVVIHGQEKLEEMPLLHWKWITAHEIGHQYWGEYVMSADSRNMFGSWLMIGMGIMADKAYVLSRNLGLEKHKNFMDRYLEGVKMRYDTTVDAPPSLLGKQNFDRNNVIIHGKGFSILSALESVLGKETFEKSYLKTVTSYGGKRLGYRDFQKICEEEGGQNLEWFFEQWVRTQKCLSYEIKSQESEQTGDHFVSSAVVAGSLDSMLMPVPIKVLFDDGTSQIQTTNRLFRENTLRFESRARLKEVTLDPDGKLAMLDAPLPVLPEDLPEKVSQLPWEGAGEEALRLFEIAKKSQLDIVPHWFKLGMTLFEAGSYEESFESFRIITRLKPDKNYLFMSLVWMGNVKDAQGEREEAVAHYRESLKYDTGISMRHDQFGIRSDRQWVEERLEKPYPWKKKK